MKRRKTFAALLLLNFAILFAAQTAPANYIYSIDSQIVFADKFHRTELYFGMNKKDGGTVSDAEWDDFLETQVTTRFPDGFTVLEGYGQYKDSTGKIVREASRVLVLFYPKKQRETVNPKIEELRAAYKNKFNQESVLRLDFRQSVAVSF